MTLDQAQAWIRQNWASENFDRFKYAEAKGFIAGYEVNREKLARLVEAARHFESCHVLKNPKVDCDKCGIARMAVTDAEKALSSVGER